MTDEKRVPLVTGDIVASEETYSTLPSSASILRSFLTMSVCFSLNHACVTTVLALSSAELGDELGGDSSGVLFICYTLIALCGATLIVDHLGHKAALVAGCAMYCFYVAIFLVAAALSTTEEEVTYTNTTIVNATDLPSYKSSKTVNIPSQWDWPVALVGSAVGGIAAGFLWTAQGGYFATACQLMVEAEEVESGRGDLSADERSKLKEEATSRLSSWFAAIYLSGELGLKLLVSVIMSQVSQTISFVVFTVIAVVSVFGMISIADLAKALPPSPRKGMPWHHKAKAVFALLRKPKLLLLIPQNAAFGFASGFCAYYVNGKIVKPYLGTSNIGYLTSISAGCAALGSLVFGWCATRMGSKTPVMYLGTVCYVGFAALFAFLEPSALGKWPILIVLYVLFGLGRATFESTNKAIFADFFPDDKDAAFAAVIVFSGGASAIAFFVFPLLKNFNTVNLPFINQQIMAVIVIAFSAATAFSYAMASRMHARELKARAEGEMFEEPAPV